MTFKHTMGNGDRNLIRIPFASQRDAEAAIQEALETGSDELDLGWYHLTEIPTSILKVAPQLKALNLSGNRLKLCPNLEAFPNLRYLNLSSNQMEDLHPSIGMLHQLEWLSLRLNRITELPNSMRELTQLHSLYLDGNPLHILPEFLGELVSLENLNLARNRLKELPESIGNLSKLRFLYARHNHLSTLPKSFVQLERLEHLNLDYNKISPTMTWKEMCSLEGEVPSTLFPKLKHFTRISRKTPQDTWTDIFKLFSRSW